ncbi:MAG: hypothetical protein EBZ36_11945, partial [Acidobacteria bacterium]|nr:hypothetical protein [Acidobacteriota bacterium]
MSKELIVSVNGREKKIAIVEDDLVTEFYVERGDENQGIVGNIYKGRVMKVLPGMQSAFVDIGLERDSFLYVSDFFDEEDLDEGGGEERKDTGRPQPPRGDRQFDRGGDRSDRGGRSQREMPRVAEVEEESEIDLTAAISHFEEIAAEPEIEITPEDDEVATAEEPGRRGSRELPRTSSRQRRQRRLSYDEPAGEEAREPAPVVEAEAEVSPEAIGERRQDAEDEYTGGRRRRRPRRRRSSDVVEEEAAGADPSA